MKIKLIDESEEDKNPTPDPIPTPEPVKKDDPKTISLLKITWLSS